MISLYSFLWHLRYNWNVEIVFPTLPTVMLTQLIVHFDFNICASLIQNTHTHTHACIKQTCDFGFEFELIRMEMFAWPAATGSTQSEHSVVAEYEWVLAPKWEYESVENFINLLWVAEHKVSRKGRGRAAGTGTQSQHLVVFWRYQGIQLYLLWHKKCLCAAFA